MIEQDPRVTEGPNFYRSMYDWMRRVAVDLNQKTTLAAVAAAMSSIATAAGFAVSFGPPGYIKFPSWLGGLIIQFGTSVVAVTGGGASFSYPLTYPTGVITTVMTNGDWNAGNLRYWVIANGSTASVQQVVIYGDASAGGSFGLQPGGNFRVNWISIGR